MCKFTPGRRDDEPTASQKYGEALLELELLADARLLGNDPRIPALIDAMEGWWQDMSDLERLDAHAFDRWLYQGRA